MSEQDFRQDRIDPNPEAAPEAEAFQPAATHPKTETAQPEAAPPGDSVQPEGDRQQAPTLEPGEITPEPDPSGKPLDLDFILDIPLQVKVEIGRTRLLIQELLQLTKGSVVELNKMLGENFEVMVNDKLIARGEVVVVNDRFGVRLTDIISPNDRVRSLA